MPIILLSVSEAEHTLKKHLTASVGLANLLVAILAASGHCAPSASPAVGNRKTPAAIPLLKEDFGPFMKKMEQRLKANWSPPKGSSHVRVKFTVDRKGTISKVQILQSSGVPIAVQAGLSAISKTKQLGPVPKSVSETHDFEFFFKVEEPTSYQQEIDTQTKAISINPNDARARRLRGNAHAALQEFKMALADYSYYICLAPNDAGGYKNRAWCYSQLSQYQQAVDDWKKAIRLNPGITAELKINLARDLWKLNRKQEAFAVVASVLSADPVEAYKLRAEFHCDQPEKAAEDLTRAITVSPGDATLYAKRAKVYQRMPYFTNEERHVSRILKDYTSALALSPNDASLYVDRALVVQRISHWKCIQDCDKAIALEPTRVSAYILRASQLELLGQLGKAVNDLTFALTLDPSNASLFSKRGDIHGRMGLHAKAMSDYSEAFDLDTESAGQWDITRIECWSTNNLKYKYVDTNGKEIPSTYDFAGDYSEELAPIGLSSRYGFIDKTGATIIAPTYIAAGQFREGLAVVRVDDSNFGFIDKSGRFAIAPTMKHRIDENSHFSEGLVPIKVGTRTGYCDKAGKVVIKPIFDSAGNFSDGLAYAAIGHKYGFINKSGAFAIEPSFDLAGDFSEGLAPILILSADSHLRRQKDKRASPSVMSGCHIAYIDRNGKIVSTVSQSSGGKPMDKLVASWSECFDVNGIAKIETNYDAERFSNSSFSDGLSAVPVGDKFGFANKEGKLVIPAQFDAVARFREGFAAARKNGKSGFIDKTGKFVIDTKYNFCGNFANGLAPVQLPPEAIQTIPKRNSLPRKKPSPPCKA